MRVSNLNEKYIRSAKKSAAFNNLLECNCLIGFDYLDILASHTNIFRFVIEENVFIKRYQHQLNKTIKNILVKIILLRYFS